MEPTDGLKIISDLLIDQRWMRMDVFGIAQTWMQFSGRFTTKIKMQSQVASRKWLIFF